MKRTFLSAAVAALFGSAGVALANPTGPELAIGTAGFSAAGKTLTVTPTAGAIINWRGFRIAPDETTRFVQPAASSTVLNRIGSGEFGVLGRLESNGRLLFMQSGLVTGDVFVLDLPGINVAALRQPLPARATARDVDFRALGSTGRSVDAWVVMIVPETVPVSGVGGALLPPGISAELADARWPYVRVRITAPPGQPLDVAQLLRKSGPLGIFGSLLAMPRGQSAGSAEEPVQLARPEPLEKSPSAEISIQLALRDPLPSTRPMPFAAGDDDIVVPVVASAEARSSASVRLAMGDDDFAAPAAGYAEAAPAPLMQLAAGDDDIAVVASAEARPSAPVLLAMGDDDIAAPAAPALSEPRIVAAAPQALHQPAVITAPAAAPSEPVLVASAETAYRRVALAASDTPVWPAPVKLERVERRMPVIMFDRKGGIFHL